MVLYPKLRSDCCRWLEICTLSSIEVSYLPEKNSLEWKENPVLSKKQLLCHLKAESEVLSYVQFRFQSPASHYELLFDLVFNRSFNLLVANPMHVLLLWLIFLQPCLKLLRGKEG